MPTAIEFSHVSKQYRLGLVSTKTLSHDIRRFWITNVLGKEDPYLKIGETNDRASKGNSEYVWALRDIDFKVEQGDVVGIIGKNGAGKSTLLKLLSRVTGPTTGTIRAHGRIGSLLEVGTGFHPEMTGRENIFMNGAILGMTKREIQAKLDEIIDFSGCERYIDTPVKRYSSGMTVRLGFAVAAFLEPEILVVDEVLAVGDAEFQKKAIGKMQDVSKGEGRTVLFVSHNMDSVRKLCTRGVLLENGHVALDGTVNEVVENYLHLNLNLENVGLNDFPRQPGCNDWIHFTDVEFLDEYGNPALMQCGAHCRVRLHYDCCKDVYGAHFSLGIYSTNGVKTNMDSDMVSDPINVKKGKGTIECDFPNLPFTEGKYTIDFWVGSNLGHSDYVVGYPLQILGGDFYKLGGRSVGAHLGTMMLVDQRWYQNGKMLSIFTND